MDDEPREKPEAARETQAPADSPASERLEGLLLGLSRIFAVVPLYPAAHGRSRAVGELFLAELRALLPSTPALGVEVHRTSLRVQGQTVALDQPQIRRIHHDLASLGVARVEIDADASADELHRFATAVLEARRRVGAARGFRQLELAELPESTRVMQREFGRRGADAGYEEHVREAVERVLEGTGPGRLDGNAQAALRSALEKMFGGVVETLATGQTAPPDGQPFARSLEDVLDLGVHALRHALDELASSGTDPTQLRGLFDAAEKALAISDDRASVEILLSVLAQSSLELPGKKPPNDVDPTTYKLSIAELLDQLASYGGVAPTLTHVEPGDRREELSVLLHVLLGAPPEAVREGVSAGLEACLAEPLVVLERSLLVEILRGLSARRDARALDLVLPAVARGLRAARDPRLLGSFWQELCNAAPLPTLDSLWPHLVNDLLLGIPGGDAEVRRDLLDCAARTSDVGRTRQIVRLTCLEAVRSQKFAQDLFDPPPLELFPVFADLLARDCGKLGERVLQGLRQHPPQWPGAEALWSFSSSTPACRAFLFALLREGALQQASPALEELARRTLANALRALPRAEVAAEWIPRGILSLGAIGAPEDLSILREIRRGFRPWPWRRWPASCRQAAASALRTLRLERDASRETMDA